MQLQFALMEFYMSINMSIHMSRKIKFCMLIILLHTEHGTIFFFISCLCQCIKSLAGFAWYWKVQFLVCSFLCVVTLRLHIFIGNNGMTDKQFDISLMFSKTRWVKCWNECFWEIILKKKGSTCQQLWTLCFHIHVFKENNGFINNYAIEHFTYFLRKKKN